MEKEFDLIVIGAGPGGYVAAVKAAKLGLKTAVLENREPGGTCLNRGCIPAKAMLHASGLLREMQEGGRFGIFADNIRFDYGKILEYKEETSAQLRQGVAQLLKANGAELLYGSGKILSKDTVEFTPVADKPASEAVGEGTRAAGGCANGSGAEAQAAGKCMAGTGARVSPAGKPAAAPELLHAKHILIATGSKPLRLPIPGIDLPGVVTSDGLFQLPKAPKSLLIIGGGVIGVEFATVFSALGTKVTIVEALPRILANLDKDFAQNLKMILKKRGVEIITGARVLSLQKKEAELVCTFLEKEEEKQIAAECVLSAVGRVPETEGLFGDGFALDMNRGRICVDGHFQTSVPDVYAIGDVTGGMQLAHAASAQGVFVAELLAGQKPGIRLDLVPSCVYTEPEIASIGINEYDAKEQGLSVSVGKFLMGANGKSLISKEERGFVKVVADAETHRILGAQMMCARATDMIGEFGTAIANRLTAEEMLLAMRAHPTYNEAVGEALEELCGGSIHTVPRRK